jgi:hypothetical protein
MPKGTPKFNDVATEVIDALTSAGWEHTGVTHAGFWTVTQMGRGPELVDVFTPAGQRQDRVWLSPAKGGKRAEKRALAALEGAGFKAAERRQKGLRIVRARARRNAPRDPRSWPGPSSEAPAFRPSMETPERYRVGAQGRFVTARPGVEVGEELTDGSAYWTGTTPGGVVWMVYRDRYKTPLAYKNAIYKQRNRFRARSRRNAPRRARRNPNRHALVDLVSYLAIQARGEGYILGLPEIDLEDTPAPWIDAKAWRGYVAREWSEELGDPMASSVAMVQSGSWSPYPATVPRSEWEPSGPLEVLYSEIVEIPWRLDRGAGASGEEGRRMWKAAVSKAKAAPWGESSRNAPRTTENPPLLPLTSSRKKWDAAKARRALKKWATTKAGRVDMRKYARAFLIVDGNPANLSSYKLPIATVVKDKRGARRLKAVPHAIYAAAGVIDGARGGVDASSRAQERAREALTRYYKKMKKAPPWGTRNPPRLRGARRNPGPTLTAAARRAPPAIRRKT